MDTSSSSSSETQVVAKMDKPISWDQLLALSTNLVHSTVGLRESMGVMVNKVDALSGVVGTIQAKVTVIEATQQQHSATLTRMEISGAHMQAVQAEQGKKIDQIEGNVAQLADPISRQVSTTSDTDLALIAAIRRFGFNYYEGLGFAYPFYKGQDLCIGFNLDLMLMIIKATYGEASSGNEKGRPTKANTWGQKAQIEKTFRSFKFSSCNVDDMDWIKEALRFVPAAYYGKLPKNKKTPPTNHSQWFWIQAQRLADILKNIDTNNVTEYTDNKGTKRSYNNPEYQCFINREAFDTQDIIDSIREKAKKSKSAQVVNLARFGRFCEGPRTEAVNKAFFEILTLLNPKVANTASNRLVLKANLLPETHTFKGHLRVEPVPKVNKDSDNSDSDDDADKEEDLGLPLPSAAAPKSPVVMMDITSEEKKETRTRARKRKADAPDEVAAAAASAPTEKKARTAKKPTKAAEPEFLMPVNVPGRTTRAAATTSSSSSSSSSSK